MYRSAISSMHVVYNGRLFEKNSDLKAMFSSVKQLTTIAELRFSKTFEAHVMKVICTIDDIITNLDDMDYVMKLLQMMAHTHCQRIPHLDAEYFWVCEFLTRVDVAIGVAKHSKLALCRVYTRSPGHMSPGNMYPGRATCIQIHSLYVDGYMSPDTSCSSGTVSRRPNYYSFMSRSTCMLYPILQGC